MGLPCGVFNTNYERDMAVIRTRTQWALLIGSLVILFCLPLFLSQKWLLMINVAGISLVAALGLHILIGLCGQISVGQAAYVGVGAYIYAYLAVHQGMSCLVAIPAAALGAGLISFIFGLPSVRVKGFYLAMMTLGAQFLLLWCFAHIAPDILGGGDGIAVPRAAIADMSLRTETQQFYLIMSIAIIALFFAKNIARTKLGRAFIAIRDNELSAQIMGIAPFNYKLAACFICGLYAGVAGALWAQYLRYIEPGQFGLMESLWYIAMVVIGGLGSTSGVVFGTLFLRGLNELVTHVGPAMVTAWHLPAAFLQAAMAGLFGLTIMLFVILEPRGLAHRWEVFKVNYRLWPFPYI